MRLFRVDNYPYHRDTVKVIKTRKRLVALIVRAVNGQRQQQLNSPYARDFHAMICASTRGNDGKLKLTVRFSFFVGNKLFCEIWREA